MEVGGRPWFLGGDFNVVKILDEKEGIQKLNPISDFFKESHFKPLPGRY